MKRALACTLMLVFASGGARVASAKPSDAMQHSAPVVLVADAGRGNFKIPVRAGVDTHVEFPSDIRSATVASKRMLNRYRVEHMERILKIRPLRRRLTSKDMLSVYVESATAHVHLLTYVADSPEEAARIHVVKPRSEVERRKAAIKAGVERQSTEIRREERALARAEYDRHKREDEEQRDREQLDAARDVFLSDPWVPVAERCGSEPVCATPLRGGYMGEKFYVALQLENHDLSPRELAEIEVRSADGGRIELDSVDIGGRAGADEGTLATVPARERTRGLIAVEPGDAGVEGLTITGRGPDGALAFMARVKEWKEGQVYIPITEEEARAREAKGRVSLHLQVLGGAVWLGDDIGAEETDATSLKGLGARVTYGVNQLFAFEAEVVGASSGDAQFGDLSWNGMQGELVRRATLGRVQLGAVARLGYQYIPTLRVGLGLQGASQEAEFTPAGGGAVQEPDVGFEFEGIVSFGTGLDVRLGRHVLAGAGISAVLKGLEELRSIEVGIHLGYAWTT